VAEESSAPRDAIEAGRLLAAKRRRGTQVCVECGQRFEGLDRRQFCTPRCYMRAYRRKRAPSLSPTKPNVQSEKVTAETPHPV
jgi:hypothetical protein